MSRAPRQWSLPGPTAFIRAVTQIAHSDGVAAVVAPPHCLPQLDAALEEALSQPWLPTLNAQLEQSPLSALSRAFEIDTHSAAALPKDRAAEGKAAFVEGLNSTSWSRWETTLRAWTAGCTLRPRFGAILVANVAPDCEGEIKAVGVRAVRWMNVIGSRDSMLWALDRVPATLDPLLGRLAVETAVALAGWDLTAIAQFVATFATSPRRMFDVPVSSTSCASAVGWTEGTMDLLDGVEFALLSHCNREEAKRRMWRAQATVLFGWLETQRTDFLARHRRAILQSGEAGRVKPADIDDLEWVDIARFMKAAFGVRDRRAELAEEARAARNALAHLEPIDYARFARIRLLVRDDRTKEA